MNNTHSVERDPVLLALVAAAVAVEAVALLLRPLIAHTIALLLTLAGWRPSPPRPALVAPQRPLIAPAAESIPEAVASSAAAPRGLPVAQLPPPPAPAAGDLQALPVRELRRVARAAGHRALARSGRRAELLTALGVA